MDKNIRKPELIVIAGPNGSGKTSVTKLWVFGSILTPRFNEESDVDLSVSFDKDKIKL